MKPRKGPVIKHDAMYQLLREGEIEVFNSKKASGQKCDLTNADFRGLELQGIDAAGLDFSGAYFRLADLRGVDFSAANLEGASIHEAKISGAYFPANLPAEEITMSLVHGTRMRYRK
jgi:uncharacterized protein YjbI with pentapeptide repeats